MAQRRYDEIAQEYYPYNRMPAFNEGAEGYRKGKANPYSPDSVEAQAWDRGAETLMRFCRQYY